MKKETMVKYDGRIVPAEGFRTFVYDAKNKPKLVESWEEYLNHINTGVWYATKSTLAANVSELRHKYKKRAK